jgi:hypothetical protein
MPLSLKLRGRAFRLSDTQIQKDAPNLFTTLLQDVAPTNAAGELELDRSPDIFELVLDHSTARSQASRSSTFSDGLRARHAGFGGADKALRYLESDAVFYQLDGLLALVQEEHERQAAVVRRAEEVKRTEFEYRRRQDACALATKVIAAAHRDQTRITRVGPLLAFRSSSSPDAGVSDDGGRA